MSADFNINYKHWSFGKKKKYIFIYFLCQLYAVQQNIQLARIVCNSYMYFAYGTASRHADTKMIALIS